MAKGTKNPHQLSTQFRSKIVAVYPEARIISACPVGWVGWELDYEVALIEQSGRRFLVTTNHGGIREINPDYLADRLADYQDWARQTKQVLKDLEESAR